MACEGMDEGTGEGVEWKVDGEGVWFATQGVVVSGSMETGVVVPCARAK